MLISINFPTCGKPFQPIKGKISGELNLNLRGGLVTKITD